MVQRSLVNEFSKSEWVKVWLTAPCMVEYMVMGRMKYSWSGRNVDLPSEGYIHHGTGEFQWLLVDMESQIA